MITGLLHDMLKLTGLLYDMITGLLYDNWFTGLLYDNWFTLR